MGLKGATMKVRMIESVGMGGGSYNARFEYDLPQAQALKFIRQGVAVAVTPADAAAIESAMETVGEVRRGPGRPRKNVECH